MNLGFLFDSLAALFLLLGGGMSLAGAVGLHRFPDALSRLHAVTKPQTFGLVLVLLGMTFALRTWAAATTLFVVAVSQLFTSPVSAHLVGRAAYRLGMTNASITHPDQLAEDLEDRDEQVGGPPPPFV